ncbi:MAG: DNA repair protein RecN [Christensenellales bacterium]|jgi:DNA repair protein RecN (Recombination protein N)
MLVQLHVVHIALIDEVTVPFDGGLNIITGETGAGKSILIDAVNLVLGGRADRELIRRGESRALVEALFEGPLPPAARQTLEELGLYEAGGSLILSRELSENGRSLCRVNGRMVPLSQLKAVSRFLVDVHGQHEHQSLLDAKEHLGILDRFGKDELGEALSQTAQAYEAWRQTARLLKETFGSEAERARRADTLAYQIEQIDKGKLKPGEEESLLGKRRALQNAERIASAVAGAYGALYGTDAGAVDQVRAAMALLEEGGRYEGALLPLAARLKEAFYTLEDVAFEVRDLQQEAAFDPVLLEKIERRLERISRLKAKYGPEVADVLTYRERAEQELAQLQQRQAQAGELTAREAALKAEYLQSAQQLSGLRRQVARRLESAVMAQLKDLGMERARFAVDFDPPDLKDSRPNARGLDKVEFRLSANPGEPLKPLAKVVSGGEMSRIMLALKCIAADADQIGCLIFDEIDTGISGRMAQVVAEKMALLSRSHQVLCVTHLPQLAAMADCHFSIEKQSDEASTHTRMQQLAPQKRVEELARMGGGAVVGSKAMAHAAEMLDQAERYKRAL